MKQKNDKNFISDIEVPSPNFEDSSDIQDYSSFDSADSALSPRELGQDIPYEEPTEQFSEPSEFNPSIMERGIPPKEEKRAPIPAYKQISKPLPPPQPSPINIEYSSNLDEMEELIESVVEEKWRSFIENFGDIAIWKDRVRTELTSVKQELIRLEERFDNLQKAVLGRIKSYDKNILEVGSEIKALEKVFQNIIQPLNTNIKELSRITNKLKK